MVDYIEDEYGVRYSVDGKMLIGYNPDVFRCEHYIIRDGVTKILANAFHNCQILKSVTMPDSVVEDEGSVFEGCKNLEEARVSANLRNPLSLFQPRYHIPKNIQKYYDTFWSLYEEDRRMCYGDNPDPCQI